MLTIDIIKQKVAPLAEKYNIIKVDLFGSYAEGCATEKSDTDLLVQFAVDIPSIFAVMGFREELKNQLHVSVDVLTVPLVRPEKLTIERTINIYERAR